MTALRSFTGHEVLASPGARSLLPATVTRVSVAGLEVRLPTGETVSPKLALAFPFTPAVGDTLLVIGQGERHYVIGVIESTGRTELRFRGDVELRAVDGTLELHGENGVTLTGPQLDIKTKHLTVLAERVTEAFGSLFTRVKSLMSVHAGASDTVVRGEWSARAERTALTSEDVISINGKEVHLG